MVPSQKLNVNKIRVPAVQFMSLALQLWETASDARRPDLLLLLSQDSYTISDLQKKLIGSLIEAIKADHLQIKSLNALIDLFCNLLHQQPKFLEAVLFHNQSTSKEVPMKDQFCDAI